MKNKSVFLRKSAKKIFFVVLCAIIVGVYCCCSKSSIAILGDSITAEKQLTNALKFKYNVYNCGVSGSRVAKSKSSEYKSFVERVEEVPDADVIVIFGGINDFITGVPLGKFEDGCSNDTTFYGALHNIVCKLKSRHPDSFFILCTPMHIDFKLKGYESKREYAMSGNSILPVHYLGGAFC